MSTLVKWLADVRPFEDDLSDEEICFVLELFKQWKTPNQATDLLRWYRLDGDGGVEARAVMIATREILEEGNLNNE